MSEILLIDAEQPFAGDIAGALQGQGFSVKQLDDGKEGLEYAREHRPDLIVLCVELPKMSGYSICNKLKKDADLKGIPLVITSKEATPETFAQHKKLKTRAEDYLIKPFDREALLEKIGGLIEVPDGEGGGAAAEEDLGLDSGAFESLDMDVGGDLPDLGDDDALLSGLDDPGAAAGDEDLGDMDDVLAGFEDGGSDSLPDLGDAGADEALADLDDLGAAGGDIDLGGSIEVDEDLGGLDEAVDGLDEPAPEMQATPPAEPPAELDADDRLAAPDHTAVNAPSVSREELAALNQARRENTDLKARVAELEAKLSAAEEAARSAQDAVSQSQSSSSTSARDVLNLKEQVRQRDKELDKLKDEVFEHEKKELELQEQVDAARTEAQGVQQRVVEKDAEVAKLSAQVEALTQERDELDKQVTERLNVVTDERDRLRGELQQAAEERDRLGADLEEKEQAARQAKDNFAGLESKVSHLEDEKLKAEEQLLKAYEQLKSEEALREKARKAAELALQILSGDVETAPGDLDVDLDRLEA